MKSELFKLDYKDVLRGAITAVFSGILLATLGILTDPGFDLFNADWVMIGQMAVNGAFAGFVGYLAKRLLSDKDGNTFGSDKL